MNRKIPDPIKYAREVVGRDPLASHLGIEVEEVREGYARCSIIVKQEHMNAVGRAHGALLYAMADQAFAVASNSTGVMAIAVSFSINYVASAMAGERVTSEATPVNIGRKVSVWNISVFGPDERLIASGQGVAYHRDFPGS